MTTLVKKKPKSSLFLGISLTGFIVVFLGFGKTLPQTISNNQTPFYVYLHAALALSWLCLFFIQSYLIRRSNFKQHKKLGLAGLFIGLMTSISILPVACFETYKELNQGAGEIAYSNMAGSITSAILYFSLVSAGIYYRKKKEVHKRLMLLATIFLIWPAWFRLRHYFPSNPDTEVWFVMAAFSLIVVAWIWEKLSTGKIHPALLYVGAFLILEAVFEQFVMYGSKSWVLIGKTAYSILAT